MFDIGWQELFLVAVLALIVIGPKDLPRALKTVTGVLRKMKGMARDFQSGLDDIVRETELADMRKQLEAETGGDLRRQIEESIDPDGELGRDLNDVKNVERDLNDTTRQYADDVNKTEPERDPTLPDHSEAMVAPSPPDPKPDAGGDAQAVESAKKD